MEVSDEEPDGDVPPEGAESCARTTGYNGQRKRYFIIARYNLSQC